MYKSVYKQGLGVFFQGQGFPVYDEGSTLLFSGKTVTRDSEMRLSHVSVRQARGHVQTADDAGADTIAVSLIPATAKPSWLL